MVANRCCGLWSNCTMFLSAFDSLSSSSFVDCGSSEKNATSDAEMSAESESNSKLTVKEIIADIKAVVVKEFTEIPAKVEYNKSVSNEISINVNVFTGFNFLHLQK